MMQKFFIYFKSVSQEFRKIVWSDRKQVTQISLMVFVMVFLTSLYFFVLDWLLSGVVELVLRLGG